VDRRADPDFALDAEAPTVAFDDMLDDREAETGPTERSAAAGVDTVEALGDAGDMLGSNPLALVGDREVDHRPFRLCRNGDRSAGFAVAERIGDEVVEQLQDLAAVGGNRRKLIADGADVL